MGELGRRQARCFGETRDEQESHENECVVRATRRLSVIVQRRLGGCKWRVSPAANRFVSRNLNGSRPSLSSDRDQIWSKLGLRSSLVFAEAYTRNSESPTAVGRKSRNDDNEQSLTTEILCPKVPQHVFLTPIFCHCFPHLCVDFHWSYAHRVPSFCSDSRKATDRNVRRTRVLAYRLAYCKVCKCASAFAPWLIVDAVRPIDQPLSKVFTTQAVARLSESRGNWGRG